MLYDVGHWVLYGVGGHLSVVRCRWTLVVVRCRRTLECCTM